MDKDNVSIITTLTCDTNTIVSADCPPVVFIYAGGPPFEAGDKLTCTYDDAKPDIDEPVYEWTGFNGGSLFSSILSDNVTLLDGEFCLICNVTVLTITKDIVVGNCTGHEILCGSASGKYGKQHAPDKTFTIWGELGHYLCFF